MSGYQGPRLNQQLHSQKPPQIDLEALLQEPTVKGVLEELQRQSGCASRDKLLDFLSVYDESGILADVNDSKFGKWLRSGKIPPQIAHRIEEAIQSRTGIYAPFLTRFYTPPEQASKQAYVPEHGAQQLLF